MGAKEFTKYHHMAIEMKYDGKDYEEIRHALKDVISINTIKSWFSKEGLLYWEYEKYKAMMNEERIKDAKDILRRESQNAAKVIIKALGEAIKGNKWKEAVEYSKDILAMSGIVVTKDKGGEKEKNEGVITYEQLHEILRGEGIDPDSGVRTPKAVKAAN